MARAELQDLWTTRKLPIMCRLGGVASLQAELSRRPLVRVSESCPVVEHFADR